MLKQKLSKHLDDTRENKKLKLESSPTDSNRNELSKYFLPKTEGIAQKIIDVQEGLNVKLSSVDLKQGKVRYVYNPTIYAKDPYEKYVRLFGNRKKNLLFVGMNPGPHGMCQTGVPFGNVESVLSFLNIDGIVNKPMEECPNRPVRGFECARKEPSGDKFWNFFKELCGSPEIFFKNSFLYNYCPIALMKDNGTNVTPAELQDKQKKLLEEICNPAFLELIKIIEPETLIAIGGYAEKKIKQILKNTDCNVRVITLPHPSPRAVGNHNWPEKAKRFIEDNNLQQYFI